MEEGESSGMSIKAMNYVWTHSEAQGTARLTLLALADSCNDDGEWSPGVSSLAKKVKLSERQTQRCLRELEQMGELRILKNQGIKTGSGNTNRYQMALYRQMYGFEAVTSTTPLDSTSGDTDDTPSPQAVTSTSPQAVTSTSPNTSVNTSVKHNPPVSAAPVASGLQNLLDEAKKKNDRRTKNNGGYLQDWQVELNAKVDATTRVQMVDKLADLFGLALKMQADDKTLRTMHEQAATLYQMGYASIDEISALFDLWVTDDWRNKNRDKLTVFKFTDFASQKRQAIAQAKKEAQTDWQLISNQYDGKKYLMNKVTGEKKPYES